MILDYYRLREQPFGATPDSRYLFASETHREALASLLYGVAAGRGFVALIAMPGMGKTTLLFESMRQLRGNAKTVFLFQTISSPLEFLTALLADLGVEETSGGLIALQAKLNDILVEQARRGERLVVVIDEAQNLNDSVLEFARMLSNFETEQQKLVQIILSGQPQLAVKLASPQLMQLRQRISMVAYLRPLSVAETELYVVHRLRLAGHRSDKPLFTSAALQLIARHSKGIPRNINNLCFNALSLGCALKRKMIDAEIIKEVIADLDLDMAKFLESEPMQKRAGLVLPTFVPALKRKLGGWVPILGFAGAVLFVTGWILIDAIR
jgi:general secretion pathway protein A